MFGKKTLNEQVGAFLNKHSERQGKIRDRIAALEAEAADIEGRIRDVTQQLVEHELADNPTGQAECNKAIRDLQLDLDRVRGLIRAFQAELGKVVHDDKAMENIRAAAGRERESRLEKLRTLVAEQKDGQDQIKDLEIRIRKLDGQIAATRVASETVPLKRIIEFIEPRAMRLPHYAREKFLDRWITGQDTEAVLVGHEKTDEQPGPRVHYLAGRPEKVVHAEPEDPEGPRCIERTYYKVGSGQVEVENFEGPEKRSFTKRC